MAGRGLRLWRSTSLRLAALYTAAFAAAVLGLAAITFVTTRAALTRQFDARVAAESRALSQEFQVEGLSGVVQAVRERDQMAGGLDYGLDGPDRRPVAGRLAGSATAFGWSSLRTPAAGGEGGERLRVLTASLPNGYRLIVGDDRERVDSLERTVVSSFAWAFVAIVVMGGLGGWALSHAIGARLAAMTAVAEGIMEGDLARRIPVTGADDDLERLAATFNQMLERIAALMESLRQVSTDIAHDLRTPLSRLRQRLEASAGDQAGETIAAALADVDALLDTFAALLRIAQIEGGGRRSAFQAVDLAEIAAAVVEAFAPSAEDAGQALALTAPGPAPMVGDRELLVQLIANLIENALRHAGPSAKVEIAVSALPGGGARLVVADDGPGVPKSEGDRIFDRFYRLERSRSTEGSGLGLALVAAVARLHGAALSLADAEPGLRVSIAFPAR